MSQLNQIRERFLAHARLHLFDLEARVDHGHRACAQDSLVARAIENKPCCGKTAD